ncbi:chaplin [Streptomyces sp. SAS_270]|uniref:chaplin n=1 Tax=Streptomyces sp. SAS_270 TaxID=3412748 RepID=UPI00403CDF78
MTAEKGKYVKHKKSAALVAGAIMALGMAAPAFADADAHGAAVGSPGVLSGNVIQVPVHVPINVCGNSVNVIALLNPAFGNRCIND